MLQLHWYEPGVFTQFWSHPPLFLAHSLSSMHKNTRHCHSWRHLHPNFHWIDFIRLRVEIVDHFSTISDQLWKWIWRVPYFTTIVKMWYLCKQTRNEWLKKLIYFCTNPILWDRRRIDLGEGNHTLQICSRVPLSGVYMATIETLQGALDGARIPWTCGEISLNYLPIRPTWDPSLQTWPRLKTNENWLEYIMVNEIDVHPWLRWER